jgi:MFS family permease
MQVYTFVWMVLNINQALQSQALCYETSLLVPSTILAYINADLGPDPSYTWIAVSWSLCAAIIVSIAGRLSDIFGRRYFMLSGGILSFIGAVIGATGQNINQMIVSGVFFGVASGIQETFYACLMELVPYKRRTMYIGMF